jgi:hypothetical protein
MENVYLIAEMEPPIKSHFKSKAMKRNLFPLLIFIALFCQTVFCKILSAHNLTTAIGSTFEKPMATGFAGQVLYVSESNDTLLFVKSENIPAEIFISVFDFKTTKWSAPVQIIFNDEISNDNTTNNAVKKELFVSLKNKKGKLDLFSFKYINGICSNLSKLNENINTSGNEKSACISDDHNTLYFSSDKKGGNGGYDIYKSERLENGEWGTAQNLGAGINTKSDEDTPFILPDNVTLYFSSKAHGSIGGFDIFNSTLSEEGIWSIPENAGTTVNSMGDEQFYYLTADEKIFFYSSSTSDISQKELNIFEFVNYNQDYTIKNQ